MTKYTTKLITVTSVLRILCYHKLTAKDTVKKVYSLNTKAMAIFNPNNHGSLL